MGVLVRIGVSAGGVPKRPIEQAEVTPAGLVGDWQRDRKHHGGPDRAVSLFAVEVIEALRGEGHPIEPGSTGENLTIQGVPWARLQPGDRLCVGATVVVQVTGFAPPCRTIMASFADRRFSRISQRHHPGQSRLYARVIVEGMIRCGDQVIVVEGEGDPGVAPAATS